MRSFKQSIGHLLSILLAITGLMLSGCGGSGGGTAASSTLSGTAATGAAIVGHIEITGANGASLTNVPINSDGSYNADVSNMAAPFIIVAIPDDTSLPLQYSYAGSVNVTVNVTPLTTLAMFLANSQQDLATLVSGWNSTMIDTMALQTAQARINANFAAQFQTQGLDETSYNFFSGNFAVDGSGFDALLDNVIIAIDMAGSAFSVQVGGAPFTFDTSIDTSTININGNDGGNGGTLPAILASQTFIMEYCCAAGSSPYNNGDQVQFTFSSSGALMLTSQYTIVSETFTIDSYGQYIWTASDGVMYVVSILNNALHEVNVMSASDVFLGQFSPIPEGGQSASQDNWNLTISGSYSQNIGGFDISTNIGPMTLNGPFLAPTISSVESAVNTSYGASGDIQVLVTVDTATQKKFRVMFTGNVGISETASYILDYDYNKID